MLERSKRRKRIEIPIHVCNTRHSHPRRRREELTVEQTRAMSLQGSKAGEGNKVRAAGKTAARLFRSLLKVQFSTLSRDQGPRRSQSRCTKMSDSDDQIGVPLIEQLSDSDAPAQPASNKRKRDADGKKSAKRRKLKKPKDVNDEALDTDLGVNHVIAHMDSRLMADHIAQRLRRFQPELSLVEVEERHIPGTLEQNGARSLR